jgi:hypothetical protein
MSSTPEQEVSKALEKATKALGDVTNLTSMLNKGCSELNGLCETAKSMAEALRRNPKDPSLRAKFLKHGERIANDAKAHSFASKRFETAVAILIKESKNFINVAATREEAC